MKIIIMKFGGTSLQTAKLRSDVAKLIEAKKTTGIMPVVVVSAIGREGDAYSTDSLLKLVDNQVSAMEKDLLSSCGETISAVVMANALQKLGVKAKALTGFQAGLLTDSNHGFARVKKVILNKLIDTIENDVIPIVTGFQGISEHGEITTLGRSGSDTTASVLAVALQAELIEIYTDVEGVYSADPKVITNAKLVTEASYLEAVEMANKGANVIHPRAVEIAESENIPIKIISALNCKNGTVIKNIKSDHPVTAISSKNNITLVEITPKVLNDYESGRRIFSLFADECISVDFIDIRLDLISFIIDKEFQTKAKHLLDNFDFVLNDGFVKVSFLGAGMTGMPGIMAKIVEILHINEISIYECTDSHTTISCLVKKEDEIKAVKALHDGFELGEK
jgi:aspartate kinase